MIEQGWLTLRPFTRADIPWVYEVSLDSALQQFVHLPSPYHLEDAAFFVEQVAIAGDESGQRREYLIEEASTRTRLGRVGVALRADSTAEVGYWVDPRARTRGVATDALRAVCWWIFAALELDLIEWHCEVGNVASRRVAEKAGFTIEGVDAWVGSLLRDEAR